MASATSAGSASGSTIFAEGEYGYCAGVNVQDQHRDPGSLLHFMERLVTTRKQCPELGWGSCQILETGDPAVFAHRCDWSGSAVVAVHNLAGRNACVHLRMKEDQAPMVELLGDKPYEVVEEDREIALEPYGYRWFRIGGARRF